MPLVETRGVAFEAFTWFLLVLSLLGAIMTIYKQWTCFLIRAFASVSWGMVAVITGVYPQAIMYVASFCMAIWGIKAWRKKAAK